MMPRKLRILIADDHQQCRWMVTKLLSLKFDLVGAVANGRELVDAATSLRPDVIVSDISMPLMAGNQAMRHLKSDGYAIPFVLISSDACRADDYIREGAMGFVAKVDMGFDLVTAVHSVCSGQRYVSRSAMTGVVPEDKSLGNWDSAARAIFPEFSAT
jgi:DNA-binding NarL/FixJ family response regulator